MRINEKTIAFRVQPYVQESGMQIIVDIIAVAFVVTAMAFVDFPLFAYIVIVLGYSAIALLLHYRVTIQAMIDKQKGDYITETVRIDQFNDEFSFAGNRHGLSHTRFFYPREMHVRRYKIKVISDQGERKKLRAVMSSSRLLKFIFLDPEQKKQLQVTYLRRSKILLRVELTKELDKKTSRKKDMRSKKQFVLSIRQFKKTVNKTGDGLRPLKKW